jgi:hypothetical protein
MKHFHSTDTTYLLRNQFNICYVQYIVIQFQWDPICNVPEAKLCEKGQNSEQSTLHIE